MKILVTGATGFVGTAVTKNLLDRGHDVRILTRSGRADFPFDSSKIEILQGDVAAIDSLNRACTGVDSVFHLAGVIGYTPAMRQQMILTNVVGTQNVIESCQKSRCRRLLYMSSVVAVGASFDNKNILNENSEFNLHHLNLGYFETKHKAEQLVLAAAKEGQIDAVAVNPSTIYGPGDAKKGSRSTQLKVARGKFPFYTSGGVNVIHIEDAVNAIYRAWEVGRCGERYILSGENLLIKELFQIIAKAAGVNPPRICLPTPIAHLLGKFGDYQIAHGKKASFNSENTWAATLFHWFDNSKARKELNLNPRPAKIAIEESIKWIKEQGLA